MQILVALDPFGRSPVPLPCPLRRIAATFKAKINRRRLDKLDIIMICEEILNPSVPMALSPSRILMGEPPLGDYYLVAFLVGFALPSYSNLLYNAVVFSSVPPPSSPGSLHTVIRQGVGGTMQASRVSVIMLQGLGISPPLARMLAEDGFNDGAATRATQPMVSPTW
ncbi:hypothetical protein D1007_03373 [Hordeum vulgare]|nr:hypothetical protein D1007_03373 [Hordeum vulgare]